MDNNLEMWAAIVGFIMPPIVAVVERTKWPDWGRAMLGFAACLGAAAVTVVVTGEFNVNDWITSALLVLTIAIATYSQFWKKVGVTQKIESLTNPKP